MIKTEFQPQTWTIEETGDADVYRIVKADKSDWIAVLRCNAINNPGFQSGDGITNVKVMVAAPELLEACKRALYVLNEENIYGKTRIIIENAINKALQ